MFISLFFRFGELKLAQLLLVATLMFYGCHNTTTSSLSDTPDPSSACSDSLFTIAENLAGSNTPLAYLYLHKACNELRPVTLMNNISRYHLVKGRILYYEDQYPESIAHLDTAIVMYTKENDQAGIAKASSFYSASQALFGDYAIALEYSHKAAVILQELGDDLSLASCYNYIGNIYLEQKKNDKALNYMEKAWTITKSDSISLPNANILSSLGSFYRENGELKNAEKYMLKAYDIRVKCAEIRHIASSLCQLAELQFLQDNYNAATKYLHEARQIYLELNDRTGLFIVCHTNSKIASAQNNFPQAIQYAENAYQISQEINSSKLLAQATQQLYEIHKKQNNAKRALEYFELYISYYTTLVSADKNRTIAKLEYQNELEIKSRDNEILLQKNKIHKQQATLLLITMLTLLIFVVVLFVIFRLKYKNFHQRQKLLEKKKQMAEAKSALHEKEKLVLENNLELKNKELTSKSVELLHQIETLQALSTRIEKLKHIESKKEIEEILHELNFKTRESVWDEFHDAFNNVHNEFYEQLLKVCPDLTSTEIKIAALLKLNLSTKEIAAISYKSESAIKTARHRLRQKLQLPPGENLIGFLMKI